MFSDPVNDTIGTLPHESSPYYVVERTSITFTPHGKCPPAEIQCRDIAGTDPLPPEDNPRHDEHTVQTWVIIERTGSLLDCPACGRILWRRPGEEAHRVFRFFPLNLYARCGEVSRQ